MDLMAVKLGRRLVISLISSIGAVFAFGGVARQTNAQDVQVGIGTSIGGIPQFVGPVIAQSKSMLPAEDNGVEINQKIVSHPYQTIDRTGYRPSAKE
jgi:hypothetical protein